MEGLRGRSKNLPGGYAGKILQVELRDNTFREQRIEESETIRKYLGGVGLGAKMFYDDQDGNIGAFDAKNPLIFLTGPFTGTIPAGVKYFVVTRSPATQGYGESNSGGFFGTALKMSGFDGLVVKGKADKPVYIFIDNGKVYIKNAAHLWGKDTCETTSLIREELGNPKVRVAAVGPAGEKLVYFAGIFNDGHNVAGRMGLGAVMGSKMVKAIAVNGSSKIHISDRLLLKKLTGDYRTLVKTDPHFRYFTTHGTNGIFEPCYLIGDVPIKNFTEGVLQNYHNLTGERLTEILLKSKAACYQCPIACKRTIKSRINELAVQGPEYEGVAALGTCCGIDDLCKIAEANELCNHYGIDVISTGVIIAFLMECYEKGLIRRSETENLELRWGSTSALIGMIHKIGKREGIGDLAANGIKSLAKGIGKGAEDLAMEVKGLEIAMHDGRALKSKGLGYAVAPVGARANSMTPANTWCRLGMPELMKDFNSDSLEDNVELCIKSQDLFAALNSVGVCMFFMAFPGIVLKPLMDFLRAVTGWDIDLEEFMHTGERIFNLQRIINGRFGFTKEMDRLPARFTSEPLKEGGARGKVVELDRMLPLYYSQRGWNKETGMPEASKLAELGLGFCIEED
ncbi:MAG TPA: aldehyde ferredoxin oxidoreductase family protein [Syntrophales bacterium]|nr:aldehyde ferredoxin oxidoreductase family protein [Syntrophales bacterium]